MAALLIGTALAVAALLYVLAPLLRGAEQRARGSYVPVEAPEATALEALREIEFDQATGKLSAEDYAALRATYAPKALAELKAREAAGQGVVGLASGDGLAVEVADAARSGATHEAAEALIARMRARRTTCPEHGARPESDALYCSDCGRYLAGACLRCGAAVENANARFCGECGASLAA